ncbi:MAG: putative quinol monooxygenase [Candidatus Acidiferrales bacterium]
MNRTFWILQLAFLISLGLAGSSRAQVSNGRLYVITHVDLTPNNAADGKKVLQQYVAETRQDPGLVRVELLDYQTRLNHFALVEVWENSKAFDRHQAADHTKKFREKLAPMLGSPYDERVFNLVN